MFNTPLVRIMGFLVLFFLPAIFSFIFNPYEDMNVETSNTFLFVFLDLMKFAVTYCALMP